MSDLAINYFNPTDVLSLVSDNWIQQENNITESLERAQGLKANGDESAYKTHGGMASGSVIYECHLETGNLVLPNIGKVAGGYLITQLQIAYQEIGWPRLTATVHQHDDNPHVDGDINTFTPSITCPAQFGIPRAFGGFSIDNADVGIAGLTYSISCTHEDSDQNGDHIAGESRDGVETLEMNFIGIPTMTVPATWSEGSEGNPKSNTAAETYSFQWEHHLDRN